MWENYRNEIDAIKLAVSVSGRLGSDREQLILDSIDRLKEYYEHESKTEYLIGALWHIQAYLELGFEYNCHVEYFDAILQKLHLDKDEVFPKRFYQAKRVKLNKGQVRQMIRRWYPSKKNTMQISEVVKDIIDKVSKDEKGVFFYRNHVSGFQMEDDIYELVIQEKDCYFHDVKMDRYYVFLDENIKK